MSLGRRSASNLVNKQFNSPIKLYSPENVQEALNKYAQALSNGAIGWAENSMWYNSRTHEIITACYTNGLLCKLYSLCTVLQWLKRGLCESGMLHAWERDINLSVCTLWSGSKIELFHDVSIIWRWVVIVVTGRFTPMKKIPRYPLNKRLRRRQAGWIIRSKEKSLCLARNQTTIPQVANT